MGGGAYGGATGGMAQQPQYGGAGGMRTATGGMTPPGMAQQPYGAGGPTGGYGGVGGARGGTRASQSQYAGARTATRPFQSSGSSSYESSSFGQKRKKPSKKTLMAMLIFICAIVWVMLGE